VSADAGPPAAVVNGDGGKVAEARTEGVEDEEEMVVHIVKPAGTGLGISIAGGVGATPFRGDDEVCSLNTLTHPFNGPFSGTTRMSRYQKGKTSLDFTEARDSGWQWHQLGHMQVCTSLQTDNHASTPPLKFFYRQDALPAAQPTASKGA